MAALNDGAEDSPVGGASVWRGADLERDRSWEFVLDDAGRDELRAAMATAREAGPGFAGIDAAAFPLPRLASVAARIGPFRGLCAPASLKHASDRASFRPPTTFPGPLRPGLIEAAPITPARLGCRALSGAFAPRPH